MTSSPWL
jgi:hypothetical protein